MEEDFTEATTKAELGVAIASVVWLAERSPDLAFDLRDEMVRELGWSTQQWNDALAQVQAFAERKASGKIPDYQRWQLSE